jgi:hypothetical protein
MTGQKRCSPCSLHCTGLTRRGVGVAGCLKRTGGSVHEVSQCNLDIIDKSERAVLDLCHQFRCLAEIRVMDELMGERG